MDAKREIEALRAEILEHNRHYYDEDAPVISDFEYDALMRRLEELEAAHPEFYDPDSPTQRVGGTAKSSFAPVQHEVPLESLTDVFSFEELAAFDERMAAAHDVIVSTTGPSRTGGDHRIWLDGLSTLAEASGTTRLFVVGGAGSLFVGDTMLKDTPGFPSAYKAESETGTQALELLRAANPSPWTLISPAPEIAPGERTGTYRTELEVPAGDAISAEDFAVAMVDEILEPKHIDSRFTVAN